MIFGKGKIDWMIGEWEKNPAREFQTRRVKKEDEELGKGEYESRGMFGPFVMIQTHFTPCVRTARGRIKYRVGRDYAVRPGRTAKGIPGLRQVITDIREQQLQDISEKDCLAEGICEYPDAEGFPWGWPWAGWKEGHWLYQTPQAAYYAMWNGVNGKNKRLGADQNPVVFAYTFRLKALGLEHEEIPR